jgi:hypothetical protein
MLVFLSALHCGSDYFLDNSGLIKVNFWNLQSKTWDANNFIEPILK